MKRSEKKYPEILSTTILGVRYKRKAALGGDGQVTFGDMALKQKAVKVRKFNSEKGIILSGFAGAAADALTLFEKFEGKLDEFSGNLKRSVVELAKEWRTDKYLRHLDALLALMDKRSSFIVSGDGNVIEPDGPIIAIGSGGGYAHAAATALMQSAKLDATEIVKKSLKIASEICIYTNDSITVMETE